MVTKDNERLYLKSWTYNAARIMSELAIIIEKNGGRVKTLPKAIISDRSLERAVHEYKDRLERMSNTSSLKEKISEQLKQLEAIDNTPITVTHTLYIKFVYNNILYYYEVNDNPFFEFYYYKIIIRNGTHAPSHLVYVDIDNKEWLKNSILNIGCPEKDIKEAADFIFRLLVSAPLSKIAQSDMIEKIPVKNKHNNDYHYETICKPEKWKKLDF